ncbi:MAG: SCO family protein [Pirellulaceae bacterium]
MVAVKLIRDMGCRILLSDMISTTQTSRNANAPTRKGSEVFHLWCERVSRLAAGCAASFVLLFSTFAWAQINDKIPAEEEGTGVEERTGDSINFDIPFHDDHGDYVRIGDCFDGEHPVILSFNYSNCPSICSVQLERMAISLSRIDLDVETDFHVVSVSIDPNEQTPRARQFKEKFTNYYGKHELDDGWHFLVGESQDIQALADECGVSFKYIPEQKLFSHPPVFLLLSPEGKIVRYIYGLDYEPITIKRALVEASEGKIGSSINRLTFLTGCYLYNPSSGKYTFQAMAIMRIAGLVTVVGLCIGLVPYWIFRRKGNGPTANADGEQTLNQESTPTIES